MKKLGIFMALLALVSFNTAFAATKMADACKDEIKKFGCKGKKEHAIHECLEKHEDHQASNDGFSAGCYEAHEAFEKAHHKEEKGEMHEKHEEKKEEKKSQ